MEQAPGHISALREQFRSISRKWHTCLGFNAPEGNKVDLQRDTGREIDA
jgi:hypothetical protein